jgi:hypothetical protein
VTPRIRELLTLLADPHAPMLPGERAELAGLVRLLLARPIPDQTVNAGYIVQHVIDGYPREPGAYRSWLVACEDPATGEWVTWECYVMDDGEHPGRLAYGAGHYFYSSDPAINKHRALRDLARRAGVPVATVSMDTDETLSRLTDWPYDLNYKEADDLIAGADAQPGREVGHGTARLTRREDSSSVRYDLREQPKR